MNGITPQVAQVHISAARLVCGPFEKTLMILLLMDIFIDYCVNNAEYPSSLTDNVVDCIWFDGADVLDRRQY